MIRTSFDQAARLAAWLDSVVSEFADHILDRDVDAAQVWGRLRVPNPDHGIDKQIAAIALVHDLTLVTRNGADFVNCRVRLSNPFQPDRRDHRPAP